MYFLQLWRGENNLNFCIRKHLYSERLATAGIGCGPEGNFGFAQGKASGGVPISPEKEKEARFGPNFAPQDLRAHCLCADEASRWRTSGIYETNI